jgi:hypothetical protein
MRGVQPVVVIRERQNPNEKSAQVSARIPAGLKAELELSAHLNSLKAGEEISPTDALIDCLNVALELYWREKGEARPVNPLAALEKFKASKDWHQVQKLYEK